MSSLAARLKHLLNLEVELVVNENRSTMLNLLEKNRTSVRLSVHKMFLEAPDPVISAIVHYVRGTRKDGSVLRAYIHDHFAKVNYTHLVQEQKLVHAGNLYHLKELYTAVNKKYFDGELDLAITWYGRPSRKKKRTRITYGQYLSGLRLIKIHRMLDDLFFPEFFVAFVVYHEMLHSVVPGSLDRRGRFCVHSSAFRERERAFEHYTQALQWEKKNQMVLFRYGWS